MTELFIQQSLCRYINDREYPFQIVNGFIYNWESDYWVLSARGNSKEFEIKVSKSDFKKDQKKDKHSKFLESGPNYFYYVCPSGIIKAKDIDNRYGLLYVWETGFLELVKKPKRLNEVKFDKWELLANKYYWKWRNLWRDLYIKEKISHKQYSESFFIDLK